jgi:protein-tyrosine phosphatase
VETESPRCRPPERHIWLDGCANFRDLGGYHVAGGRSLRWGRLFRSGSLGALSETDRHKLEELNLATVIDLRTDEELARTKAPRLADVAYHHLPLIEVLPTREEYESMASLEVAAARYLKMLAGARSTVAEALAVLCQPGSYPAVVHCSAGKDRTGVLSALVLGMVGVSDDQIAADYALSARAGPQLVARLSREYPEAAAEIEANSAALVSAEPETMQIFLDAVRAEHGSFAGLAAWLGMPEAPDRLQEVLVDR